MTITAPTSSVALPVVIEPRPFGLVRHSLALARRSLTKTLRQPEQLLDVTLQPLIFVLLFVYLLGGAVAGSSDAYLQVLLPAIMVQQVMFAGMATGVNLNSDIGKGVFDRLRSLPIGRSAPLLGSVLGDLIRYVVAIASLLIFGAILGYKFAGGFAPTLLACVLTILFAFSVSWLFVLLGMLVREPGTVQGLGFLILFPFTFGTSMIAPTATLPGWLQDWVHANPVAHVMDMARGLMLGEGPTGGPILWTVVTSAGFLAVFVPLAVRAYMRRT
ncbi:ABC transporter permease [Actinocrispum wychmicini]|uniref:Transport permease protein n=1 Tax=Actinocrispum wychmicini TaxID=1213861 RepID=A0A4R2J7T3_9PSEU|nr:ABC transporter permease [Actinocrispum wychmicini]TCO53712.1 oleandomycin transport system permease protein [Actinocrispum wychmicini]